MEICESLIKEVIRKWQEKKGQETPEEFAKSYMAELESSNWLELWEDFWGKYPRKVGKKKARAKFLRMPKHAKLKAVEMLPKYLLWVDIFEKDTLHPTTYLNQERFFDEDLIEIPKFDDINEIRADVCSIFRQPLSTDPLIMKSEMIRIAKIIMKFKAKKEYFSYIARWMYEIWGKDVKYRPYVNMNTILNSDKFYDRLIKAKEYANKQGRTRLHS